MKFIQKYILLVIAMLLVISLIAFSSNPFEETNKFEHEKLGEIEISLEQETVVLEVVDKTPVRYDMFNLITYCYLLKVKSDNPLFNGKTIIISQKDLYNKYEIGQSYPFTFETKTTTDTRIRP